MPVPVGCLDISPLSRPIDAQSSHPSPPSSETSLVSTPLTAYSALPRSAPSITSNVLQKLKALNLRIETNVGSQDESLPNPNSASADEKGSPEQWVSLLSTLGSTSPTSSAYQDPMADSCQWIFDAPSASVASGTRGTPFLDDPHYAYVHPGITLGLCPPNCPAPRLIWTCATWEKWATRAFTHIIRVRPQTEGKKFVAVDWSTDDDGVQTLLLPLETRYWAGMLVPFDGREIRLSLHQLYEARLFLEDALSRPDTSVLVVTPPGLPVEAAAIAVCLIAAANGVPAQVASKDMDAIDEVSGVWKRHFTPMDLEYLEAVARLQC